MWTRETFLKEDLKLPVYERIVKHYLRYVLLRCCEYTNSRREAEQIAAYTLISTCSLLEQLRQGCDLAWLLDSMLDVIGREQSGGGRLGAWEQTCGSGPLLSDEKLQKVAGCVNRLEGFSGQVLVLGLIEKMAPKMISEICGKSVEEIVSVMDGAERELAEHLHEDSGTGSAESVEDVCGLMCELGNALELDSRERITRTVLRYLARDVRDDCRLSGRFAPEDLN
jgi:DNA-directed RNA polymerase specialized sigma24 family protein